MDNLIQRVIILGGGTAGWMTAAYLNKALEGNVKVTVIEAPSIPRIGVGEATIPNLQSLFFDFLGLREEDWMKHCKASFKGAVKFVNWQRPPVNGVNNHFYHLFGQIPSCDHIPLSQYWFLNAQEQHCEPLEYACFKEAPLLDAQRSPKTLDGQQKYFYAWHFDAQLVANFLRDWSVERGVEHITDVLEHVTLDERGYIDTLHMQSGATYKADLYVDCSGFRGLLINKALEEPFLDMSDYLLCDSAVAAAIPHDDAQYGIEPYTSAIALNHGWCWKIPLLGRFGAGYVFSSKFASMDEAEEEFIRLWNLDPSTVQLNKIRFRTGRNRRAWVKNCVSIGLASCFVEPLESTGIYFIYAAAYQLVKHFPDKSFNQTLIDRFNREIELMYDDTRDFIQAHYLATPRTDTPFWRANRNDLKIADSLQEKIEAYKAGLPVNQVSDVDKHYSSFETEFHNFWNNTSYYSIWAGLGYLPDQPMTKLKYQPESRRRASALMASLKQQTQDLLKTLPSTYEYLRHYHLGEDVLLERAI